MAAPTLLERLGSPFGRTRAPGAPEPPRSATHAAAATAAPDGPTPSARQKWPTIRELLARGVGTHEEFLGACWGQWPPNGLDIIDTPKNTISIFKFGRGPDYEGLKGFAFVAKVIRDTVTMAGYARRGQGAVYVGEVEAGRATTAHEQAHVLQNETLHEKSWQNYWSERSVPEDGWKPPTIIGRIRGRFVGAGYPPYLAYTKTDEEVQARLAETIGTAYRHWNKAPATKKEFWAALEAMGVSLPPGITAEMDAKGSEARKIFRKPRTSNPLSPWAASVMDINYVVDHIKDAAAKERYFREALPGMYGEYLEMVGDRHGLKRMDVGATGHGIAAWRRFRPEDGKTTAAVMNEAPENEARSMLSAAMTRWHSGNASPEALAAIIDNIDFARRPVLKSMLPQLAEIAVQAAGAAPVLAAFSRKGWNPLNEWVAYPDHEHASLNRLADTLDEFDKAAKTEARPETRRFNADLAATIRENLGTLFSEHPLLGRTGPQTTAEGFPGMSMPVLTKLRLMDVHPEIDPEIDDKVEFVATLRREILAANNPVTIVVPKPAEMVRALGAACTGLRDPNSTVDLRPLMAYIESINERPKRPPTPAGENAIGSMLAFAVSSLRQPGAILPTSQGFSVELYDEERRHIARQITEAAGWLGPGTAAAFTHALAKSDMRGTCFTLADVGGSWDTQVGLEQSLKVATQDLFTGTWCIEPLTECGASTTHLATLAPNGTWVIRGDDLGHGADHVVIGKDGTNIFRDAAGHNTAVARPGEGVRPMPGRTPVPETAADNELSPAVFAAA